MFKLPESVLKSSLSCKKIVFICMLIIIIFIIWYLMGLPGGRLPGRYDSKVQAYHLWYIGKSLGATKDGIIFIKFFNPLSQGIPHYTYNSTDSLPRLSYDNKYFRTGAIDSTGKIILPAIYDRITPFRKKRLRRLDKDSLKGIFDCETKKIVLPVEYRRLVSIKIKDKNITILKDKDWNSGFADSLCNIIVPCKYQSHYSSYEHIAFYNNKDSLGRLYPDVYDYDGNLLISGDYEYVKLTEQKIPFFTARNNNKEGYYVDKKNREAYKTDFVVNHSQVFFDSLIVMTAIYSDSITEPILWRHDSTKITRTGIQTPDGRFYPTRYGLTDLQGNILLPFTHDLITNNSHEMLIITKDGNMGLMNKKSEWIIPLGPYLVRVLKNLPLIEVRSKPLADREWRYFTDLNGTIILSGRTQIACMPLENEKNGSILFLLNGKMFELTYNDKEKYFEWERK